MKKEEYVKRREELLHEIRVIKDQIRNLEIQYINESTLNQFTIKTIRKPIPLGMG